MSWPKKKNRYRGLDPSARARFFRKYDGCCVWCGVPCPDYFELDHLIPFGEDGGKKSRAYQKTHHLIVLSCRSCNLLRRHLPVSIWLRWLKKRKTDMPALFTRLSARHQPLL